MARYMVGGRGVVTSTTQYDPEAVLWNASTVKDLYLTEVGWSSSAATTANIALIRTTTRGTPGSTVTPDIDNDRDRLLAPASGALLDLGAFTGTLPTTAGPSMGLALLPNVAGSQFVAVFRPPIRIPAGTGLAMATSQAAALGAGDVFFVWDE